MRSKPMTLGDYISWWSVNGHFNIELYTKISLIKAKAS